MQDSIVLEGTITTNFADTVAQFRSGHSALDCKWEAGGSECNIERVYSATGPTPFTYNVKIGDANARGLSGLNFAAAMETTNTFGAAPMDFTNAAEAARRGPQLCIFQNTPHQMACALTSERGRFTIQYETEGGRNFDNHESACADLQGRINSGECHPVNSGDPCVGISTASGPRSGRDDSSLPARASGRGESTGTSTNR